MIGIGPAEVTLEGRDGGAEHIPSRAVWPPAPPRPGLAGRLAELDRAERDHAGRVTVEADLTLPGHPEVFAVGDMIRARDPGGEPVVRCPVSHPPRCSKGVTRPGSSARGYEGLHGVS